MYRHHPTKMTRSNLPTDNRFFVSISHDHELDILNIIGGLVTNRVTKFSFEGDKLGVKNYGMVKAKPALTG